VCRVGSRWAKGGKGKQKSGGVFYIMSILGHSMVQASLNNHKEAGASGGGSQ